MKKSTKVSITSGIIIICSTAIGFLVGTAIILATKPSVAWIYNNVIFFSTFAGLVTGMVIAVKNIFKNWLPLWREEILKQIDEEQKDDQDNKEKKTV